MSVETEVDPSRIADLTRKLVHQNSISGTRENGAGSEYNESILAYQIKEWFDEHGVRSMLQELPDGRHNVIAYVPGKTNNTVVLAGHYDTVKVDNYLETGLKPDMPFDSDILEKMPGNDPGKYLYGRGCFDMKSGDAVGMHLMDHWTKHTSEMEGSVIAVFTCDEEDNSWGILNAVDALLCLKGESPSDSRLTKQTQDLTQGRNLNLLGLVNLDYTTARYPGDPEYHTFDGTIGKLLPAVYIRGQESHVGEHFNGFHAATLISRITTAIEGNMDLADKTVPPTTLKLTDNRRSYDVMTERTARAYYNVFTTERTPAEIMEKIKTIIKNQIKDYIGSIKNQYEIYRIRNDFPDTSVNWENQTHLLQYSELKQLAVDQLGDKKTTDLIQAALIMNNGDNRDKCFAIIETLLSKINLTGPTAVVFYAPPYYPYVRPDTGVLGKITRDTTKKFSRQFGINITAETNYPYISDMSYLKLEPEIDKTLTGVTEEMPVFNEPNPGKNGVIYSLPFDKIKRLNLPMVNVGPYGSGAHQTTERVEKFYSFTVLPQMVDEIVRKMHRIYAGIKA
jgi:arginine utilization protein RocB